MAVTCGGAKERLPSFVGDVDILASLSIFRLIDRH